MSIKVNIDGKDYSAEPGETLLSLCQREGISIPHLCAYPEKTATACMLCLVENSAGTLQTSCNLCVSDKAQFQSRSPAVLSAVRDTMALLLAEHRGDCYAPCSIGCPGGLDIQGLIAAEIAGDDHKAAALLYETLALPQSLGLICRAPCQKRCRRQQIDSPLPIAELHTRLGAKLAPPRRPLAEGPVVAVIGSGPAGLGASLALLNAGYRVSLYEQAPQAGGGLRAAFAQKDVTILDNEIKAFLDQGIQIRLNCKEVLPVLAHDPSPMAIVICAGTASSQIESALAQYPFLSTYPRAVAETNAPNSAIHAYRAGRRAASQLVAGLFHSPAERFRVEAGPATIQEQPYYLAQSQRIYSRPSQSPLAQELGLNRCLACACTDAKTCQLQQIASQIFPGIAAKRVRQSLAPPPLEYRQWGALVYHKHKCLRCGRCVHYALDQGWPGPCFEYRGRKTAITLPLGAPCFTPTQAQALCAICPSQALSTAPGDGAKV